MNIEKIIDRELGEYIGVDIPKYIVKPYLNRLKDVLGDEYEEYIFNQKKRDSNHHHITVINPIHYKQLQENLGVESFEESLEEVFDGEYTDIQLKGIGSTTNGVDITYFIVVDSEQLQEIRIKYQLPLQDFHITLGFKDNDVFGVKKNKVKYLLEQTSSGASGSFETPMGSGMARRNLHPFFDIGSEELQTKKKKKHLNKKKKPMKKITVSEIENIILKTLIQEEVYSEKPIEPKGREISSKNAKSQITSKSAKKVSDITAKSGKESKSDVSVRNKKVSASLKNNLKNAQVADVNKDKKVNDDYETEAYQNGMEDIAYERISDGQKKKNVKNIGSPEMRKSPNAEKGGKAAEKMISQAKKRKISRDASPFAKIAASGTDIEFLPDSKKQPLPNPRKKLAFENVNTMKRLTFKSHFRDDKDMLRKIPSNYKQNDLMFEMYDGDSNYRVRWEGTETYGVGVIIEHKSASKEMKNMKMFESLNKFDRLDFQSERNVQSSTLNENQMFKQMLNQSRRLMNESPDPEEVKRVMYFGKKVRMNTVAPMSDQAGIDTEIKNDNNEVDYNIGGQKQSNIIAPAPTFMVTRENLDNYNKVLSGEEPYTNSEGTNPNQDKFNFEVTFNGSKYLKGIIPNVTFEEESVKRVMYYGKKVGINTVAPMSDQAGIDTGLKNNNNEVEYNIGGEPYSNIIAPAPTEAISSASLEGYNNVLRGEEPYTNSEGTNPNQDKFNFGIQFNGEVYSLLGSDAPNSEKASPAETGSQAKINTTNDRAFDYKLENGKYFFKGKGAYASKYPNWVEATGRGLEAIKANVKF
jgi:hypothetical protein